MSNSGDDVTSEEVDTGDHAVEEKISPTYSDTSADIKLLSSDGWLFYVESFYLRATCQFFRDLYKKHQLHVDDKPISLDFPKTAITAFLDLITTENDISSKLRPSTSLDLVKLGNFFDCDRVRVRTLAAMNDRQDMPFWSIVLIASYLDKPQFVVDAIVGHDDPVFTVEVLNQLDPAYAAALINTYLYGRRVLTYGKATGGHEWGFNKHRAADQFTSYLAEARAPRKLEPRLET